MRIAFAFALAGTLLFVACRGRVVEPSSGPRAEAPQPPVNRGREAPAQPTVPVDSGRGFALRPLDANVELESQLQTLVGGAKGRVGICALDIAGKKPHCVAGDERFPLQSVMKLVVAAAICDAVDRKQMRLDDVVTVRPEQASPGPQEFADLVRRKGTLETTVEALVRRSIIDSDSTSIDVLIERLGGVKVVQEFMARKNVADISIDRNERGVQAQSVGLEWRNAYADPKAYEAAIKAMPHAQRQAAWEIHLKDTRDTATPLGMVRFLQVLANRHLLSESSTDTLLAIMAETSTGIHRLKAGLPKGWTLAHKTGTGRTWNGVVAATNDVGLLMAPDGGAIAVAVFVTESGATNEAREALIANAAALIATAASADAGRENADR